jgi:hypothetical protein
MIRANSRKRGFFRRAGLYNILMTHYMSQWLREIEKEICQADYSPGKSCPDYFIRKGKRCVGIIKI